jgi:hypothetical protein
MDCHWPNQSLWASSIQTKIAERFLSGWPVAMRLAPVQGGGRVGATVAPSHSDPVLGWREGGGSPMKAFYGEVARRQEKTVAR